MVVAYDEYGYSYDVATGYYLSLYWDEYGEAYNAETGERVDEIIVDNLGTKYSVRGGGIDWEEIAYIAAQAYAAGQGAAQSGRYIPNPNQSPQGYETLNRPPARPPASQPSVMPPGPGGSVGLNISTNTLMLIVGGFLLFMLGSKKGR